METHDLYWLAGLLEGEGCFSTNKRKYTLKDGSIKVYIEPYIQVQMTDEDVVNRAAELLGVKTIKKYPAHDNKKALYRASANGKKRCVPLMNTLLPLMGHRRQEKIQQVLSTIT